MPKIVFTKFIGSIPYVIFIFTNVLNAKWTGTLATFLNMSLFITTLESVSNTLSTKKPESINVVVTLAAGFNSTAWMMYALSIKNLLILIPNLVGLVVFVI